jgi:hypothetical protein
LGVERILCDGWQTAALISALAERNGLDQSKRRLIKLHSRRYFAGRGLGFLSEFRRNGAGLRPILNVIWRFRRNLSDVDPRAIVKLVATILCPRPIADRFRRLKQL